MPHDLNRLEHDLTELIGRPTQLRPFSCDGDPLRCKAMIVGTNPATAMPTDWWKHWQPGSGYDIRSFEREYAEWRASIGKRRTSITRERRNQIEQYAEGMRVLQTNAFAFPCSTPREIPSAYRNYAVLEFLIDRVRPRVILALGGDACSALDALGVRDYQTAKHPAARPNMTPAEAFDLGERMRLGPLADREDSAATAPDRILPTDAVAQRGRTSVAVGPGRRAVPMTPTAGTAAAINVPRTKHGPGDPVRETEREKKVRRYLRAAREVEVKGNSDARNKLEGCKLRLERFWAELGWPQPANGFERDALARASLLHRCRGQST